MGSRAIVVVCRDADVANDRFGSTAARPGAIYTRTGRPFLQAERTPRTRCSLARAAVDAAGLWDELGTEWLVLDCELLPWSAKADRAASDASTLPSEPPRTPASGGPWQRSKPRRAEASMSRRCSRSNAAGSRAWTTT